MKSYFNKNNVAMLVVFLFLIVFSYVTELSKIKIISSLLIPILCIPFLLKELKNKSIKEKMKIIITTTISIIAILIVLNTTENSFAFNNFYLPGAILLTAFIVFLKCYFKNKNILLLIPILWGGLLVLKIKGGI